MPNRWIVAEFDDDDEPYFVTPTSINQWEQYVRGIAKNNETGRISYILTKNLAHRFQLLEMQSCLLVCDYEFAIKNRKNSTLHETLKRFNIHLFCVTAHSMLEGIGSYFYRCTNSTPNNMKINTDGWRKALAEKVTTDRKERADIKSKLKNLTDIRDKIHLDRIDNDETHFSSFEYTTHFIPSFKLTRNIMSRLNSDWPEGTILNEEF